VYSLGDYLRYLAVFRTCGQRHKFIYYSVDLLKEYIVISTTKIRNIYKYIKYGILSKIDGCNYQLKSMKFSLINLLTDFETLNTHEK
jgi:hypothetical protein